jgi:hypothetical protein
MDSCSEQPSMMSQSDFLKNAGRWGGSDVAARHYRAAVLSYSTYVESAFMWSDLAGLIAGTVSRAFDST